MTREALSVAMISDVFFGAAGEQRLQARLREARAMGAELAVLPELPLNPWSPATKQAREDDVEAPNGPRCRAQAEAAREAGIALVGGAIVRDPRSGRRCNTALVFDAAGAIIGTFAKLHLPEEPGFWETSHYEAGAEPSPVFRHLAIPFGVQICSDINRPEGCHALAAAGAELIVVPRASEAATYSRWRIVFQANALTSCAFVMSVNRPAPEQGVLIGGPSIAVGPDGGVMLETTEPVGLVTIERESIRKARIAYPGYLPVRSALYARAWSAAGAKSQATADERR